MNQKKKILLLLSDREWHSMVELNDVCFRYGGRIHDLRSNGIDIEKEKTGQSYWRYRLVTPNNQIDFDNQKLKYKPLEQIEMGI